jgi:hypothetical protein
MLSNRDRRITASDRACNQRQQQTNANSTRLMTVKTSKGSGGFNQENSTSRRRAVSGERSDELLRHHIRPSTLIVSGNAAPTATNILASEMLFRAGIVSELICAAEFIFLVRAVNRLRNGVNKTQASLMVTLGLIPLPIMS